MTAFAFAVSGGGDALQTAASASGAADAPVQSLALEVKGTQSREVLGRSVECVRVDGTEATSMPGPPPIAVAAGATLWYCPTLRAVGRAETAVPGAPRVTQTLVAARSAG